MPCLALWGDGISQADVSAPTLRPGPVIFQDFPGPGIFNKKIQDFPAGMGTLPVSLAKSLGLLEWFFYRRDGLPVKPTNSVQELKVCSRVYGLECNTNVCINM